MRAFVISKYAHPSEVRLTTDAPEPKPGNDEVLVDVYSAGLNFYDVSRQSWLNSVTLLTQKSRCL